MEFEKIKQIATAIYKVSEPCCYFPALTGGNLYKEGDRKDIDIVMYEKRNDNIGLGKFKELITALSGLGFWFEYDIDLYELPRYFVYKAINEEMIFDFIFPTNYLGSYDEECEEEEQSEWRIAYNRITGKRNDKL